MSQDSEGAGEAKAWSNLQQYAINIGLEWRAQDWQVTRFYDATRFRYRYAHLPSNLKHESYRNACLMVQRCIQESTERKRPASHEASGHRAKRRAAAPGPGAGSIPPQAAAARGLADAALPHDVLRTIYMAADLPTRMAMYQTCSWWRHQPDVVSLFTDCVLEQAQDLAAWPRAAPTGPRRLWLNSCNDSHHCRVLRELGDMCGRSTRRAAVRRGADVVAPVKAAPDNNASWYASLLASVTWLRIHQALVPQLGQLFPNAATLVLDLAHSHSSLAWEVVLGLPALTRLHLCLPPEGMQLHASSAAALGQKRGLAAVVCEGGPLVRGQQLLSRYCPGLVQTRHGDGGVWAWEALHEPGREQAPGLGAQDMPNGSTTANMALKSVA